MLKRRVVDLRLRRRLITLGHLSARSWNTRGLPSCHVRRFILLRRGLRAFLTVSSVPAGPRGAPTETSKTCKPFCELIFHTRSMRDPNTRGPTVGESGRLVFGARERKREREGERERARRQNECQSGLPGSIPRMACVFADDEGMTDQSTLDSPTERVERFHQKATKTILHSLSFSNLTPPPRRFCPFVVFAASD